MNKLIVTIIILIIVLGGGYYIYTNVINEPEQTDETADWQTYQNEDYKFKFKYPDSYYPNDYYSYTGFCGLTYGLVGIKFDTILLEPGTTKPPSSWYNVEGELNFVIDARSNHQNLTAELWIEQNCQDDWLTGEDVEKRNVIIDGIEAIEYKKILPSYQEAEERSFIIITKNQNLYFIYSLYKEETKDFFEKLLVTFKFVE